MQVQQRQHRLSGRLCVLAILSCASLSAFSADAVSTYIEAATATLPIEQQQALERISTDDLRLLALRAYVRAGKNLRDRWSWTDEQIRTYEKSVEYDQLRSDIAAITREFERRHAGYTLYANTQVRSLDTQIERWNANPRVAKTAAKLREHVASTLRNAPRQPDGRSVERFVEVLKSWRPSPAAPLAAPGLSMHGQSRAIDFQIMKGGKIVAATEVGAVTREWDEAGWTRRLKEAIAAASPRFKGPLASPNEPWHYEYVNLRVVADDRASGEHSGRTNNGATDTALR